jgi:hypothetical protein
VVEAPRGLDCNCVRSGLFEDDQLAVGTSRAIDDRARTRVQAPDGLVFGEEKTHIA